MADAVVLYDRENPAQPVGTDDNPLKVAFTLGDQPDIDIGNVDVESVIPGTGPTNLGKAEDAAHVSGDVGVMALAVRKDTAVAVGADGDYVPVIVDSTGRLWVRVGAIEAGENLIGKVVGSALVVTPSITVDTAAYAIGDVVGGKITLANAVRVSGGSSLLQQIHLLDRSNQKPTGNILIFNADPSAATTTDNAAFVYSTDDLKQVARIPVTSSDWATLNSKATADLNGLGRVVKTATGTSLYAVFVTDGAPDFVAGTDFQIIFKFLPVD